MAGGGEPRALGGRGRGITGEHLDHLARAEGVSVEDDVVGAKLASDRLGGRCELGVVASGCEQRDDVLEVVAAGEGEVLS